MGNANSNTKRRTKEERNKFKENRTAIATQRKQEIEDLKQQCNKDAIKQIKNTDNEEQSLAVLSNMNNTTRLLDLSKTQLDREGLGLTKADLIAIIVALEPKYMTMIDEINKNTIPDLNTIIRVIIYDPKRYVNTSSTTEVSTIGSFTKKMSLRIGW
jgi:hypothetical protein